MGEEGYANVFARFRLRHDPRAGWSVDTAVIRPHDRAPYPDWSPLDMLPLGTTRYSNPLSSRPWHLPFPAVGEVRKGRGSSVLWFASSEVSA
jgi:hypothetical protein